MRDRPINAAPDAVAATRRILQNLPIAMGAGQVLEVDGMIRWWGHGDYAPTEPDLTAAADLLRMARRRRGDGTAQ